MLRVMVGLVIPVVAVVFLLPVVDQVQWSPWNIPFSYLWLFAWFILTSVCLAICWFCFDRHRTDGL
ncbi:DUF3311 domain-containing protein [Acidisoma sp. 7E03]